MIVEPFAGNSVTDNMNPVGRLYYAASTMLCVPNALAFSEGALGAQAGEARIGEVVREAGFVPAGDLKEQRVHPAQQPLVPESFMNSYHRQLYDIRGRTLDRRVYGEPFTKLPRGLICTP